MLRAFDDPGGDVQWAIHPEAPPALVTNPQLSSRFRPFNFDCLDTQKPTFTSFPLFLPPPSLPRLNSLNRYCLPSSPVLYTSLHQSYRPSLSKNSPSRFSSCTLLDGGSSALVTSRSRLKRLRSARYGQRRRHHFPKTVRILDTFARTLALRVAHCTSGDLARGHD